MAFLSPLFLVGAALAAVPIVLHLLKRQPEPRVKFAAVKLLKHAPVEHTQRHRLRELLLLALRVAALVLLALAFARPFLKSGSAAGAGGVTIVALDTSYSLGAPGRFERAKQLARQAVDRARPGERVGVVTFADEADLTARPTLDRALAISAIDEAAVGFGATRYRPALAAAAQLLPAGRDGGGTIVVVTDLQETGWDSGDRAAVPEAARIEIADVGLLPANLAVVGVRPMSDRVVATIRNTGPAREARVRLVADGRAPVVQKAPVGPNESAEVVFDGAPGAGSLSVAVDDPDGIQADNVRYAVVGGSNRTSVAVVTATGDIAREAFYVQQALGVEAAGAGPAYQVVGLSGPKLTAMTENDLASYAAVLLLSTRGLERHGRDLLAQYVRGGGGLLLAAGSDVDGEL
ncbi:MAG TPA: BatA domain-containing protein, partial [Vicinamibacterales bacterium]|nr:BatA domain-containing protein [Vicinamibacterales bacterium]